MSAWQTLKSLFNPDSTEKPDAPDASDEVKAFEVATGNTPAPQAPVGQLQEVADTHPGYATVAQNGSTFKGDVRLISPARLHALLVQADAGDWTALLELGAKMEEADSHMAAEMSKRRRGILTLPYEIAAPADANEAELALAAWLNGVVQRIPDIEDVLLNAMDAVGHGFSCQELLPTLQTGALPNGQQGKYWVPESIEWRPQSLFQLDRYALLPGNHTSIRLRDHTPNGAALWPSRWLVHIHRNRPAPIQAAGLYRSLVWAFLFKHYSLTDCAEFLEIYGLPMRVGTYPNNASAGDKRTLLRALVGLGHDAAAIVPEGMLIEFKEAAKVGGDVFLPFAEYMDRAMSKAIVGQTLSAQSGGSQGGGGGSHALGKVHADVQRDILLSDARQVASTINRDLIAPLIQYNVGAIDPARMPRFVFDDTEPEDMALLADALPKLASAGLEIDVDYVHKRLKIPRAEAGATLLKGAAPAMPFGGGAGLGGEAGQIDTGNPDDKIKDASKNAGKNAGKDKDQDSDDETPLTGRYKRLHSLAGALNQTQPMDAAAHMEALMHREAQAAFMATIDDIRLLVANATSAAQLQDDMLRLYGELDATELGERIALGMTALRLRGMADVVNEANAKVKP